MDFCVHPSNEYLLAVSDQATLYVWTFSGELRAKFAVSKKATRVACDTSGLYCIVGSDDNNEMFEIGTGRKVFTFLPGRASFGTDCRCVAISRDSLVQFYRLDSQFVNLARRVVN